MIKLFTSCIGKYKKYAIIAPIGIIFEVLFEVLIPFMMNYISDALNAEDMTALLSIGGLMVLFAILSLICGILSGVTAAKASAGFAANLRKKLFLKIQNFSFKNTDKFSTSSLITRLTTDVENVQMAFMMLIRGFVRAPIMIIMATTFAFATNVKLALIFVVALPLLAGTLILIISRAHKRFKTLLKVFDDMNAVEQENLIGIRAVKAFVREDYETEKFVAISERARDAHVKAERILIFITPIMMMIMFACVMAVIGFGGMMTFDDSGFDVVSLTSYLTYTTQILMSLMMMGMILVIVVISRASLTRIKEVLDEDIDIKDDTADENLIVSDGSIDFSDVNFSYSGDSDKSVLNNINLHIESGETIGIIGATGSAKTTLVQMIPRLYDVDTGSVKVGGHNVKEYKIKNLRNAVSMVLQKNVLFSGTIKDNLKWGNENATDEEIVEATKAACAHDFIMSFPDGYDTELGQGGVNVSGGQKQRLCIARALLKKPKILILDDSTSAVDTSTDKSIRESLKKIKGITVIIVAQRIASVGSADRVIVMDEGRIDAFDTPQELLKSNTIYQEVYNSQMKGAQQNG